MSSGDSTLFGMARELPADLRYLARRQYGVVSRTQAMRTGLSAGMIKFRIRSGRWQQLHLGVYATFTGAPGRGARLWAALLAAGPGAVLSYETAAELQGLADKPVSPVHVTVPHGRHIVAPEGVCLHRSDRALAAAQAGTYPPRTTVEETVLDLTQVARTFDDVCGWVTRAIARELTDETRLHAAMTSATGCAGGRTCTRSSRQPSPVTIRCWSSATTGTSNELTACPSRAGRSRSPRRTAGAAGSSRCGTAGRRSPSTPAPPPPR